MLLRKVEIGHLRVRHVINIKVISLSIEIIYGTYYNPLHYKSLNGAVCKACTRPGSRAWPLGSLSTDS